jgi:GDP-L-fucose synthase
MIFRMSTFWGDKRVLVTGGSGFLGAKITECLRKVGASGVVVPRSKTYNLVEQDAVRRLFKETKPDLVIHGAAVVGGIGANRDNPGRFFYENLLMGALCMEEARLSGVRKFVAIGTICAYPKFCTVPFREDDLWNGYPEETNAPYGLAKKMLLVQAQAYRQQYGFNAVYLLPVNLYGPGDNFNPASSHVIPALIRKCLEAKAAGREEIEVWGTGSASREFLYADDCAEAIVLAAEKYDGESPVNLGSGRETSVRDLVGMIARLCGFTGKICWNTTKPDGQPRRCLDVSRAEALFGFKAHTSLEEGLIRTIESYRAAQA